VPNIASYITFNTNKFLFQDLFQFFDFKFILADNLFPMLENVVCAMVFLFSCFLRIQGNRPWEIAIWTLFTAAATRKPSSQVLCYGVKHILFLDSALLSAISTLLSQRDGIDARLYSSDAPMCIL